jgi:hypothetical protein
LTYSSSSSSSSSSSYLAFPQLLTNQKHITANMQFISALLAIALGAVTVSAACPNGAGNYPV